MNDPRASGVEHEQGASDINSRYATMHKVIIEVH
jgi:hypothetical protein